MVEFGGGYVGNCSLASQDTKVRRACARTDCTFEESIKRIFPCEPGPSHGLPRPVTGVIDDALLIDLLHCVYMMVDKIDVTHLNQTSLGHLQGIQGGTTKQ